MGLHPHAPFPSGFELIETWWVVFLHHDVLIEMAGVEFLVLAFAGTYAIGRTAGLEEKGAFFAAAMYSLTPGLHLSATSCLNDAPVAALVVTTMALVAARAPGYAAMIAMCLGVGVKPTFAYALPGIALLWWLTRKESRGGTFGGAPAVALAILAAIVGSFWYVRNLVWFGNPVYPVGERDYGRELVGVQYGPSLQSFVNNLTALVDRRIYDSAAAQGANVDHIAGWGPAAFSVGLLALLITAAVDPSLRRLAAAFATSLATSLLLIVNDPWCLKYVFYFPAVLALATARLSRDVPRLSLIAGGGLALAFASTLLPYDLPLTHLRQLAGQSWNVRSSLPLSEEEVPAGPVGCFGGFTARSYLLYGPDFSRKVLYLRAQTAEELISQMKLAGVSTCYCKPRTARQAEVLRDALEGGGLVPLKGSFYALK
jgi:hypothetical protein